jgi:hypothetical protein
MHCPHVAHVPHAPALAAPAFRPPAVDCTFHCRNGRECTCPSIPLPCAIKKRETARVSCETAGGGKTEERRRRARARAHVTHFQASRACRRRYHQTRRSFRRVSCRPRTPPLPRPLHQRPCLLRPALSCPAGGRCGRSRCCCCCCCAHPYLPYRPRPQPTAPPSRALLAQSPAGQRRSGRALSRRPRPPLEVLLSSIAHTRTRAHAGSQGSQHKQEPGPRRRSFVETLAKKWKGRFTHLIPCMTTAHLLSIT